MESLRGLRGGPKTSVDRVHEVGADGSSGQGASGTQMGAVRRSGFERLELCMVTCDHDSSKSDSERCKAIAYRKSLGTGAGIRNRAMNMLSSISCSNKTMMQEVNEMSQRTCPLQ